MRYLLKKGLETDIISNIHRMNWRGKVKKIYDVIIIGGGVVGSAIARELARYEIKVGVLEKNADVCLETSGRNSAVIHGGFAYDPGTLKARLCLEGNQGFDQLAKDLDFPFLRCGKVLVGNTRKDLQTLKETIIQGEKNGVTGLELISKGQLKEKVPAVIGDFAMFSPSSGITDPFLYTIALAENAAVNGVNYYFETEVVNIEYSDDKQYKIITDNGVFFSRWIVNSAGLGCGIISEMLGIKGYKLIGSKGDYIILDKRTGPLLPMPVYPVPSNTYMGIHVTNTIDGNVIIGPNAEMVEDFSYYGVSKDNIDYLEKSASLLWPCIRKEDYIRNYSGILPKWVDQNGKIQDFKIEIREDIAPCAVNLIGIESPGLTAAVPIARMVVSMIREKEVFIEKKQFQSTRQGIRRFAQQSLSEKKQLIQENSDYGEVICRCENVTKAELLQAIHNPLRVSTITGIKYRTRSMMGRCQGGYCQMKMAELIQQETGRKVNEVQYARKGSYMFTGKVREEL